MEDNNSFLKKLEDRVFVLEQEYIWTIPDDSGQLNNVLQGIEKEYYCTRLDDQDNENNVLSLIHVNRINKVRGHLCQVGLFDPDRNDIVFGFSKFLEKEYNLDFFRTVNHWQNTIRTAFEKLEYFTMTTSELDKLPKGTIILKGRRGLQAIPFVDKYEALKDLYSSLPEIRENEHYVYLMMDQEGFYKIGRSKNPLFRERTLKSQEKTIQTIAYWKAPKSVELELHKKYSHFRERGEWFKLSTIHLGEIKEYMSQFE